MMKKGYNYQDIKILTKSGQADDTPVEKCVIS
jgi:hypothetical protein